MSEAASPTGQSPAAAPGGRPAPTRGSGAGRSSARAPRPGRRDPWLWAAGLALVVGTAVAHSVDSGAIGLGLYLFTVTALHLADAVGPVLRGARPRRVWLPQTLAGVCLIASILGQVWTGWIGPFEYKDIAYFTGYALLVVWLTGMCRHVGGDDGRDAALDTAAAAVGTGLALWVVTLAPVANGSGLLWGLVWTVYPTADALLIALTVHLTLRLGVRVRSAMWLIGALVLQTALDVATSVAGLFPTAITTSLLESVYLFSFLGIATAACHPSVVDLTRPQAPLHRRRRVRAGALTMIALLPPILSTLVPLTGRLDMIVRAGLMTTLLALVFARLTRTLRQVHHAEAVSRHRATHDSLTGLLNRAGLLEALGHRLARNADAGRLTALVFLDLDDFKHVNDTWGHEAGDLLLRDVAARLAERVGPGDRVARQGGDEFVVVSTAADACEAVALGRALQDGLTAPLRIRPGRRHAVSVSIGVALTEAGEAIGAEELLRRADIGMYDAKSRGRGRVTLFDRTLAERARARARIGDRIEDAIRSDAVHVALQPVMGGPGYDELLGWEALARWQDDELGAVPPDEFVAAAEQLGLMRELSAGMLRRACRDVARLHRAWPADSPLPGLSVNVSPSELLDPGIVDVVRDAAHDAGLPLRFLRLEVTETLLVDNGPDVLDVLERLRAEGVGICIDDFGTGYASLSTLLRLPVDAVKIDRSLVSPVGIEEAATRQLGAVFGLLRSLGIERIVAEGVETREQEDVLLGLKCPSVQGWRYGRAAPAEAWLPGGAAGTPVGAGDRGTGRAGDRRPAVPGAASGGEPTGGEEGAQVEAGVADARG